MFTTFVNDATLTIRKCVAQRLKQKDYATSYHVPFRLGNHFIWCFDWLLFLNDLFLTLLPVFFALSLAVLLELLLVEEFEVVDIEINFFHSRSSSVEDSIATNVLVVLLHLRSGLLFAAEGDDKFSGTFAGGSSRNSCKSSSVASCPFLVFFRILFLVGLSSPFSTISVFSK